MNRYERRVANRQKLYEKNKQRRTHVNPQSVGSKFCLKDEPVEMKMPVLTVETNNGPVEHKVKIAAHESRDTPRKVTKVPLSLSTIFAAIFKRR